MNQIRNRVSIVIPAYNEERYLPACLDAIAAQTIKPFEVIVVDNNSSDSTAKIAAQYPFVRVVNEPRRGIGFARNAGFNAAAGDIIGRIDADTHVPASWVAKVQDYLCSIPPQLLLPARVIFMILACAGQRAFCTRLPTTLPRVLSAA